MAVRAFITHGCGGAAALAVAVVVGVLTHSVSSLPYYDLESQSTVQTSLLTTKYFDPESYERMDYSASFDGYTHVASPLNSDKDMRISLSRSSFTIELWLKHDRGEEESWPAYFISQGSWRGAEAGDRLLVGFKADNTFEVSFYDGQALVTHKSWTGDRGQWHHWAITFDKDSMERMVYRDGVLVGSDLALTQLNADTGLQLGYMYQHPDLGRDLFFKGQIDELRLWETVLEVDTIRRYASLTSAWVTDFHPNVAYLLAYFDFNEDSGPIRLDADLYCGSDQNSCSSTSSWWSAGVGSKSLDMGSMHRVHKICPTPALANLDWNNTALTYPDFERSGDTRPLPSCTTDLQHRHEILCSIEFTLHVAYQAKAVPGFPRYYLCDGVRWMPANYDHHVWNNFMLP
eukprot:CAMPEP_0117682978 /NCGR_PEP_ID=MMETSP0804-20121206/20054_1 /TAXON_ID=1074897 /ORGANISM="Tetraselmis astigmatica, Strain CCMP880" /LENGTH=401 /DNA_ID=CAMNT_0005493339 /DNA_START=69 /DNA_END=1274 /DNA_ORIENTATION=-